MRAGGIVESLARYELACAPDYGVRDLAAAERLVRHRLDQTSVYVFAAPAPDGPGIVVLRDLPFDSAVYGFPMAEVMYNVGPSSAALEQVLAASQARGVRHIHYRAAAQDPLHIQHAERCGFRFVSVFVGLACRWADQAEYPERPGPIPATIRPAGNGDLPALEALMTEAFADGTRFHADPALPREKTMLLHTTWIANSLSGEVADVVLVAEASGTIAGAITCRRENYWLPVLGHPIGAIGLFAVSAAWRARGIGTSLISAARRWFLEHGVEWGEVGTEGSNFGALRTYQSTGFRITRTACSLHCHLPDR